MINAIQEYPIEEYSCHKFEVVEYRDDDYPADKLYGYKIYGFACQPYDDGVIDSCNNYDSEQEARFAAIGHIVLLENGEG